MLLTPTQPFRLLDLPAELWSKIGKIAIDDAPSFTYNPLALRYPPDTKGQPDITRICRVLRDGRQNLDVVSSW